MKDSECKQILKITGECETSKFDETYSVDEKLEIVKELVAASIDPIMECMRDCSNTIKKKKCYELVKPFVDTHRDEIVDKMYGVFEKKENGATMIVGVATNPNLRYRITNAIVVPSGERNTFEILVVNDKNGKPITIGTFTWMFCPKDESEIEKMMSDFEQYIVK